jgi:lipoate-protein ligase A
MPDPPVEPNGTIADKEWRLIREESLSGATTMAFDEVAANTVAAGGPRTVRVYRWHPSTLSLGYRQDASDVNWARCEQQDIDVVRRPTGGGAIYHDGYGDISYSIIAPTEELPGDLMETYELLCEPVLAALRAAGIKAAFAAEERTSIFEPACFLRGIHPAHDIVTSDGRKLAGNAQYRTREAVVQHGSFSFATAPEQHVGCFDDCNITADRFETRVATMDDAISREHVVEHLEQSLAMWCDAAEGEWTADEQAQGAKIAAEKFQSEAWTRDATT